MVAATNAPQSRIWQLVQISELLNTGLCFHPVTTCRALAAGERNGLHDICAGWQNAFHEWLSLSLELKCEDFRSYLSAVRTVHPGTDFPVRLILDVSASGVLEGSRTHLDFSSRALADDAILQSPFERCVPHCTWEPARKHFLLCMRAVTGIVGAEQALQRHGDLLLSPVRAVLRLATSAKGNVRVCLKTLSRQVAVSDRRLARLFKSGTGLSFREFLRCVRLTHAAELLRTTASPLTEIGAALGYDQSSHFVREFRTEIGVTPSQFRQEWRRPDVRISPSD
jgi:AraC-like DNA-binding protein